MVRDRLPANLSSHERITQIGFSFIKSSVISKLHVIIGWGRETLDVGAHFCIHCLHQCHLKRYYLMGITMFEFVLTRQIQI